MSRETGGASFAPRSSGAARAAAAALAALAGRALRLAARKARERVGLRAAAIGALRVAAVTARLLRRCRRRRGALRALLCRGALLIRGGALLPGLRALGALFLRVLGAFGPLLLGVLRSIAALVDHVLAMVLPVVARILARVVVVVPRVVVHVAAAAPAVRAVIVIVVERGADGDAGGEADQPRGHGCVVVAFLLHDHCRGLGVDDRGVVLRDVDHLRVGRLDHDHLLSGRRRLGLHLLLRRRLQRAGGAGLGAQALDAVEHGGTIGGEGRTHFRRPVRFPGHPLHDVGEKDERGEAGLEAGL